MGFSATIVADSVNPDGRRLTTFLCTIPRSVLPEANTHRMLSRNAASSRAVPTRELVRRAMEDPYIPTFGANKAGMSAGPMAEARANVLRGEWLGHRDRTVEFVMSLVDVDDREDQPHKQDVNRLLEPFLFMEWVVSGTDWPNFFFQRCDEAAHPGFQGFAYPMAVAWMTQTPEPKAWGEAHLPFVSGHDLDVLDMKYVEHATVDGHGVQLAMRLSAARCGRVSFAKQGDTKSIDDDLAWFDRHVLKNAAEGRPPHVSPAEHPARAFRGRHANYDGWCQLRKSIRGENRQEWGWDELWAYEARTGRPLTPLPDGKTDSLIYERLRKEKVGE